jgi:hypothetical protein
MIVNDVAVTSLTLGSLRDPLRQSGYRAETISDPASRQSFLTTGGLAVDLRPGNRLISREDEFANAVWVLQVQGGQLPPGVINSSHMTRRFAPLYSARDFVVLAMDLTVAGGVLPMCLRGQIELWDRLAQEFAGYLRGELPKLNRGNGVDAAAALGGGRATETNQLTANETA